MKQNIKQNFKDRVGELLQSKVYLVGLILVTIAAYGFTITHFSLGIDDFGIRHYMNLSPEKVGNMLQQGRLLHILFYYVTGLVDVIPFLNNLIGAVLLFFSAVFYSALFDTISQHKLKPAYLLMFACLYVSNSIMSFKFIYDIDVVVTMFSYFCIPLAVVYSLSMMERRSKKDLLASFLLLMAAISSYESFNAVYICSVLFVLILLAVFQDEKARQLLQKGLCFAGVLVCALVVYYTIVKIVQAATGNIPYARSNIFSVGSSVLDAVKSVVGRVFNGHLLFAMEFSFFAVCSVGLAIYFSIRKKNPFIFLLFFGMGVFSLAVQIVQGFLLFRACQTFNLYVACMALLCMYLLGKRKILDRIVMAAMVVLLCFQLKDINLWFYKDWANYQKNVFAMHEIAKDLQKDFPVREKPVCFVNRDYESYLMTWDEQQAEIGEAPLIAAIGFLGNLTSPEMIQLFEYQGYDFLIEPSPDQAEQAIEDSKGMPPFPKEGYIKETDEVIIVNFGHKE